DLRVFQRRQHALAGELPLAAAGLLGELGRADAGDRGLAGEAAHAITSVTVTRAVTCTPRLLLPVTVTVARSSVRSTTSPRSTSVSPGKFGTPRRNPTDVIRPAGPVQSVM